MMYTLLLKKSVLTVLSLLMVFSLFTISPHTTYGQAEEAAQTASAAVQCFGAKRLIALKNRFTGATKVSTNSNADTDQELNTTINCVLDSAAIILRETLIRKITSSIVTWINTGFEGSPSFVTNIDDFLLDTADEAFGTYIFNESNFAHLCSPFQFDIRFALALSYSSTPNRPACTLSDIVDNVETAIDDLSVEWDWDVFETITTDPSGNVFSSYIQSQGVASDFINNEISNVEQDIARGSGFLSYQNCEPVENKNRNSENPADGSQVNTAVEENCEIVTPGSVIGDTLTNSLNLDLERIGLADEFNEIVGALVGQLAQQAFGREGVSGLTERSGGSSSFVSQFNADVQNQNDLLTDDLANETSRDTSIYTELISEQNEIIDVLLRAKIQISETEACFASKYNTWVDADGNVIPPNEVINVPESQRTRATFTNGIGASPLNGDSIELLLPDQSLAKVNEYNSILTRIDQDLLAAESNIEQAQLALEITARYLSRLEDASGVEETRALFNEYISGINALDLDVESSLAGLQNIEFYTDQALNGTISFTGDGQERTGGAIQDLATCRAFNQVVVNQTVGR